MLPVGKWCLLDMLSKSKAGKQWLWHMEKVHLILVAQKTHRVFFFFSYTTDISTACLTLLKS